MPNISTDEIIVYEKIKPGVKIVILPAIDDVNTITGTKRRKRGLYADFKFEYENGPITFDPKIEAKIYVDTELKLGKIKFGDKRAYGKRYNEIVELIKEFVENTTEWNMDPPRIFPRLTDNERKRQTTLYPCPYCEEVLNSQELQLEHMGAEHAKELATMASMSNDKEQETQEAV